MNAVIDNQLTRTKSLILASILIGLIGCSNQKYSQCQKIIAIANEANNQAQKITESSSEIEVKGKNWLKASNTLAATAKEINDLPTKDIRLIDYQKELATVFTIYSQAISDAVQARENKNLSALKQARQDAQKAEHLNKILVTQINSYCSIK